MILTAHQPVYLPWLGLFHKIALADLFVSFNQVQYQPKDWNNRNKVMTAAGPVWLTVPVRRSGYLDKTISDIEIDNSLPWARKHWRTLHINYHRAPHFARYADFFEDVYARRRWSTLVELNEYMLTWFLETLGIKVPVRSAAAYRFQGEKSALVLDMCRQLSAEVYIFGTQGRDYADIGAFQAQGVKVVFQDYHHPEYEQQRHPFVPYLSVVDLLFNCGPSSYDVLMSGNVEKHAIATKTEINQAVQRVEK
jgi:hypothetical protein